MMEFYKVLEKIMKSKDLTIPEVARLCNLSDSTVRSIFTRKQKTVALNIAFKIADGLCIPLEVLNGKEITEAIENTKKLDEDTRSGKIIWKVSHQEVQKLTQETDNFISTDSITKSSMSIGENIKKYRKEKGLTQKELADKIGKDFSTVQKYELNISQPPIDVLNRIADTLDIDVSKLFYIENTLNQSSEDEAQRQEMYLKELREDTINKYDSLDPFGQKAANKYINFLAKDEE
jgi:transcriptional regulator with XRE-family HTH domain